MSFFVFHVYILLTFNLVKRGKQVTCITTTKYCLQFFFFLIFFFLGVFKLGIAVLPSAPTLITRLLIQYGVDSTDQESLVYRQMIKTISGD